MKNYQLLIIFAIVFILIIVFRKKLDKGLANMTRGYKNNNPGNIRLEFDENGKKKIYWLGEIEGSDKDFKTFKNMSYGYRAIFVNLNSYTKKGINTIRKIISTYAPSNENDTSAYIKAVVNMTGLKPDEIINYSDPDTAKKVIKAISIVENGVQPDMNEIDNGYKLFKA